jgi:hypothetical protein
MENTIGHILKSNDVKLEGQFRLDAGQPPTGSANKTNVTSAPAQARVVENHPEFAVIEVICGCGAKTHIKCQYPDTNQDPNQKNIGENNNAS